uniref:Uncharacterized protein n=1 Tax=Meloidogyne enterolobii TaxID=390850 RepID=A0A6V7WDF2_MELEN|nr:unnamed protein product [Meloidogyne enterolobii]
MLNLPKKIEKAFAWLSFVDYQRDVITAGFFNDLEEYKNMSLAEIRSDSKDRFYRYRIFSNRMTVILFFHIPKKVSFN